MATPAAIADALLTRAGTLSVGSPVLPIAMPDVAFDPPADGRYIEVSVFFNRPAWQAVAAGKLDQGLLQITVVWPPHEGMIKPAEIAGGIMAHFAKGLRLSDGVKISGEPWAATPIIEESESRLPMTIPWTA